jgi:hypothetical protein
LDLRQIHGSWGQICPPPIFQYLNINRVKNVKNP